MKLTAFVCGALWLACIHFGELSVCSMARMLPPADADAAAQGTCIKCDVLDKNKKELELTIGVMEKRFSIKNEATLPNIQGNTLNIAPLRKRHHGKNKGRLLAIDEIDYAGPRTHPPTKPPRR